MKKKISIPLLLVLLIITNLITGYVSITRINPSAAAEVKIKSIEKIVEDNYLREVDESKFLDGQLKGIVASLDDPYSEYYTADEYKALIESTSGRFYGIGVQIAPGDDGLITVISPIKDTPADRAGIKPGDKIISVDGTKYTAKEMDEAVKHMKGDKGTEVTLSILSEKTKKVEEVTIVRDEIKVESILKGKIDPKIGYIGITQFEEETGKDFEKALSELMSENIQGLVLDLRGNPGGILDDAVEIADLLLPKAKIVSAKDNKGKEAFSYESDEAGITIPIVVLVNEGSASASEILAGALQDNGRATLVGKQTFGKGVVQSVIPFRDGTGIKLTTSEYFTPNGTNIHGVGIKVDEEVDLPDDIEGIGLEYRDTDTQLQRAIEILQKSI